MFISIIKTSEHSLQHPLQVVYNKKYLKIAKTNSVHPQGLFSCYNLQMQFSTALFPSDKPSTPCDLLYHWSDEIPSFYRNQLHTKTIQYLHSLSHMP